MIRNAWIPFISITYLSLAASVAFAEVPENFRRENLVVWCVAPPWDLNNRNAEERATCLSEMGIKRMAFNWRREADFEEEMEQCAKHGIDFFAFWNEHEEAFGLFEKRGIRPQIWKTNQTPKVEGQQAKVKAAADRMMPFAQRAKELGCRFGLYNHGRWGGEPRNLVAVCEELRDRGLENVGIVYNFHHAHPQIEEFADSLKEMLPYLMCLNLNGMADAEMVDEKTKENKILPIGGGLHEGEMIKAVVESGYKGPIGIIGHLPERDVEEVLRENLDGLDRILASLSK
ncbi:MAG: TIM barrel protein [Verrucomicrobiota bacterium]